MNAVHAENQITTHPVMLMETQMEMRMVMPMEMPMEMPMGLNWSDGWKVDSSVGSLAEGKEEEIYI